MQYFSAKSSLAEIIVLVISLFSFTLNPPQYVLLNMPEYLVFSATVVMVLPTQKVVLLLFRRHHGLTE